MTNKSQALKYQQYPKHRDSEVEWLGRIPEGWETMKLQYCFDSHAGGVWGSEEKNDNSDMVCVRVADFDFDHFSIRKNSLTYRSIPESQLLKVLKEGDILLEKSGGGEKQPVGRAVKFNLDKKSVCSNFIEKLDVRNVYSPAYVSYLLGALYFNNLNTRSIKQTTGIQNLDIYSYFSEIIPHPPLATQKIIANFLDQKTARIDQLIQKNKKLIKLFEEKRQAIITQAVTKGLDPNVEMKESGVVWIGKIPKSWEVKKLKFVAKVIMGQSPNSSDCNIETVGLPFLQGKGEFGENHPTPQQYCEKPNKISIKNDILLSVRAPVGEFNFADQNYGIGRGLCALRTQEIEGQYLWYLLSHIKKQLLTLSTGSTFEAVSVDDVKNLLLYIPSRREQQTIAKFLDYGTRKIDTVMVKIEQQIEKLQEYRQALISNVVTGKIKV